MFESHYGIEKMAYEQSKDFRQKRRQIDPEGRRTVRMNLAAVISLFLVSGCAINPLMVAFIRSRDE